ncbi:MAG: hypothetical protein ABUT39_11205 [Acidobacteriota bacterium]
MAFLTLVPTDESGLRASIEKLGKQIQSSSNFRFASQFFFLSGPNPRSPATALSVLNSVILLEPCHQFLRETFDPMYDSSFKIEPVHEHCEMAHAGGEFENLLASAANDHLGAYSHELRDSTPTEAARIRAIFEQLGPYCAFQLMPGGRPGCGDCRHHNNHLFSTWFYGVAWDWCFVLTWPGSHKAWVACLTDTD